MAMRRGPPIAQQNRTGERKQRAKANNIAVVDLTGDVDEATRTQRPQNSKNLPPAFIVISDDDEEERPVATQKR